MNSYGDWLSTVAAGINTDGCLINFCTVYLIDFTDHDTQMQRGSEVLPSLHSRVDSHRLLLIRPWVLIFRHRTHANWRQAHAFRCNLGEWACVQALIRLVQHQGFQSFVMCVSVWAFFFLERGLRYIINILPLLSLFRWIKEDRVAALSTMQISFYLG